MSDEKNNEISLEERYAEGIKDQNERDFGIKLEEFGRILIEKRKGHKNEYKRSREAMALKIAVNETTIWRWETGKSTPRETKHFYLIVREYGLNEEEIRKYFQLSHRMLIPDFMSMLTPLGQQLANLIENSLKGIRKVRLRGNTELAFDMLLDLQSEIKKGSVERDSFFTKPFNEAIFTNSFNKATSIKIEQQYLLDGLLGVETNALLTRIFKEGDEKCVSKAMDITRDKYKSDLSELVSVMVPDFLIDDVMDETWQYFFRSIPDMNTINLWYYICESALSNCYHLTRKLFEQLKLEMHHYGIGDVLTGDEEEYILTKEERHFCNQVDCMRGLHYNWALLSSWQEYKGGISIDEISRIPKNRRSYIRNDYNPIWGVKYYFRESMYEIRPHTPIIGASERIIRPRSVPPMKPRFKRRQ